MIYVFGDGFRDNYINGTYDPIKNRFVIPTNDNWSDPSVRNYGGADNVADHLKWYYHDTERIKSFTINQGDFCRYGIFTAEKSNIIFETFRERKYSKDEVLGQSVGDSVSTIIISTYGYKYFENELVKDYFNYIFKKNNNITIIIDAKYRDIPDWFFDLAKNNNKLICRCTGEEYDLNWVRKFNIVIHTNHSADISLICIDKPEFYISRPEYVHRIHIPKIEPVNTCGAGDTFTATLAWYLDVNKNKDSLHNLCQKALPLCIAAAQDVCMQPYTNVPRLDLIERIRNWPN